MELSYCNKHSSGKTTVSLVTAQSLPSNALHVSSQPDSTADTMPECLPYRLRACIKEKKSLKRFFEENVTDEDKLELLKWQDRADGWTALHLSNVKK